MITHIAPPDPHEDEIRRALLQRLADDLAIARHLHEHGDGGKWPCCWLHYDHQDGDRTIGWLYEICRHHDLRPYLALPDDPPRKPCYHWHHQAEVFLA